MEDAGRDGSWQGTVTAPDLYEAGATAGGECEWRGSDTQPRARRTVWRKANGADRLSARGGNGDFEKRITAPGRCAVTMTA